MGRPGTRSKNKRQRAEPEDDSNSILRKIHNTNSIPKEELDKLYNIGKPVCKGCRVNTKDNPNCYCGFVPASNGSRKFGLWQKTADIEKSLGADPSKDLRDSDSSPAGLTNLGATCYANSILQCLYMNESFRQGLFCVEQEVLGKHPVLDQLARLFAQLYASKLSYIDPAPFITTLQLDNDTQQDSHEFLTLFLSLLETSLSDSKVSKARTIVQDLFRGSVSNVTTCSKCGKDSEASSKMEDFYALELNVKDLKTLDESLDDYLSVEELHGDNQYLCEYCNTRVNATRSIKLRTLPKVLNFHLKRYVFLPKTTGKKKISSMLSFPEKLDMQHRLSEPSQVELIYDLSAVLIHKGSAANSGHYIAHIKDENTGQWWKFDDEHVSNLGHHPFGEGSSVSTAKTTQTEPVVYSSCKEGEESITNQNHLDAVQLQQAGSGTGSHVQIFSSADAYMLMYNLKHKMKDGEKGSILFGSSNREISLPPHLDKEINELNASYIDSCEQFKLKKERELDQITRRRQEVRSVLGEAPVQSDEKAFYWISTDWLRQWADTIAPSALDNTSIQCLHGKVPTSKVGSMKRLSTKAWTKIFDKYGGGPTLTQDDYCMDCLFDVARTVVSADSYRDQRTSMRDIADNVLSGKCDDGTYYVSKQWLQKWVKRKNLDAAGEADAGPTSSIACPHGQLLPEQAAGAKRLLVPENLWLFFYEDAIKGKPEDSLGCSTFPSNSQECLECSNALGEADSIRALKLVQRQNHESLAAGKSIPLDLNCTYYLVPSSWLIKWRSYITAVGKNISSSEKPEILDVVIDMVKCEKHSRLLERAPSIVCKRGTYFQKSSTTEKLTIVTENDWIGFCEGWGGIKEKGISAMIEASNEIELTEPVVRTCPEVCEVCIGERESCELVQKLSYSDEYISVFLVRGNEAPKSILEAAESSEPDRRTSKRSRRTNDGKSVNLKVSASMSVYQLKMMIWESLGVVKENQILKKGSRIIDEESATLADMNILPGDKLWVKDSEIHEDRDIADELADTNMNVESVEEGFRGTLLTANVSSQVV